MKTTHFLLTAIFGFALISCSSGDESEDGDSNKKRNLGGCFFENVLDDGTRYNYCMEPNGDSSDEELNASMKKFCEKHEKKYLPEGCPDGWKAKCHVSGITSSYTYIYDAESNPGMECKKK